MESLSQECSVREDSASTALDMARPDDPPYVAVEAANDALLSQLARTIEYEIIPRLMLAHRATGTITAKLQDDPQAFTTAEVESFARLVMSTDEDGAMAAIGEMRARHVPVERLYTDLLAPTARHLGALWDDDLCSFTDVTIGLGRLQRVLRELSTITDHPAPSVCARRILLLPSPGEQHTFGLLMVGEFFRRAGWDVSGGASAVASDAISMVEAESFDAIGFSMGAEVHVPALASTIARVRHATCNPSLVVLVGGPLFADRPDLVETLGADGMTIDGREAPSLAERLVAAEAHQSHG